MIEMTRRAHDILRIFGRHPSDWGGPFDNVPGIVLDGKISESDLVIIDDLACRGLLVRGYRSIGGGLSTIKVEQIITSPDIYGEGFTIKADRARVHQYRISRKGLKALNGLAKVK